MRSLKTPVTNLFLILGVIALVLPVLAQNEAAPQVPAPQTTAHAQLTAPPDTNDDALMDMDPPALDGPPLDAPPPAPQAADVQQPRQQPRRMTVEMRLRAMMSDFGLEEPAKQDALIAYLAEDEAGKATVRDASRRLLSAVKRGTPPDKMRDVIAVYKNAIATDKERRAAAQISLDAKIGFSLDPHLEAVLWLFGVLGDGQSGVTASSLNARPPGPTGRNQPPNRGGDNNNNRGGGTNGGMPNPNGGNPFMGDNPNRDGGNPFFGGGGGGNNTGADPNRPQVKMLGPLQRAGVVFGTVVGKGDIWIDVKTAEGIQERYMPFWTTVAEGGGYNRAVIDAITAAKTGDLVRLEWVLNEKKRVVKLDPWVPDATDKGGTPPAETPTTPAPPVTAPTNPAVPVTAPPENNQP